MKERAIQEKFRVKSTSSTYCSAVVPPETATTSYISRAP